MDKGYILLGIVALLFLSLYVYANAAVILRRRRIKQAKKFKLLKEVSRLQEKKRKQAVRDEKLRKIKKRREVIRQELNFLAQKKIDKAKAKKLKVKKSKSKKAS